MNSTAALNKAPPPTTQIRQLIAFSYLVFSIAGIIPNLILLGILRKLRSEQKNISFFVIAAMLSICDISQLLAQIVVPFPLSLYGYNVYENTSFYFVYVIFTVMDTFGFNGVLYFTMIMALNRFTVFMLPNVYNKMFGGKRIFITVLAVWSYLCFTIGFANLLFIWKTFSVNGFYLFIKKNPGGPLPDIIQDIWYNIMKYQSYVLPAVMFVMYLILFFDLRKELVKSRKNDSSQQFLNKKMEIRLLIQGAIIVFFLEIQTLSFTFFSRIVIPGYGFYYLQLTQNIISILNNSVNPYVYLIFNQQIRELFLAIFSAKRRAQLEKRSSNKSIFTVTNRVSRQ